MTNFVDPDTLSRTETIARIVGLVAHDKLCVNTKITETQIAGCLGLDKPRTPKLRESLAVLAENGVIEVRPQRGYWILPVSTSDAREITELRSSAEAATVIKLAGLDQEKREPKLRSLYSLANCLMAEAPNADFLETDAQLRFERARAAGFFTSAQAIRNWSDKLRIFESAANPIWNELGSHAEQCQLGYEDRVSIVNGHRNILGLISAGDGQEAAVEVNHQCSESLVRLSELETPCNQVGQAQHGAAVPTPVR